MGSYFLIRSLRSWICAAQTVPHLNLDFSSSLSIWLYHSTIVILLLAVYKNAINADIRYFRFFTSTLTKWIKNTEFRAFLCFIIEWNSGDFHGNPNLVWWYALVLWYPALIDISCDPLRSQLKPGGNMSGIIPRM